jgi:hypothetical protein
MRIKSPVVTLIVGVLIAAVVLILSVRADHATPRPYGAAAVVR